MVMIREAYLANEKILGMVHICNVAQSRVYSDEGSNWMDLQNPSDIYRKCISPHRRVYLKQ